MTKGMKNSDKDWYECRIKYRKQMDDGTQKKVTETYVVSAVSVSDAEQILLKEIAPYIEGDSAVTSVKEASFKEIFQNEEELFYLCKVCFLSYDEENGSEKKTSKSILVQADDFKSALANLEAGMKGSGNYEIVSIATTSIIDILC